MVFTGNQHFALRPGQATDPKKYWKLQRIPVLEFLGLNSTAQRSYSLLTLSRNTTQKHVGLQQ